jgi:hypothetical protein
MRLRAKKKMKNRVNLGKRRKNLVYVRRETPAGSALGLTGLLLTHTQRRYIMRTFCKLQLSVQVFAIVVFTAAGGGTATLGGTGSIEFTEVRAKKKGTIEAKGKAEHPKGYSEWVNPAAFKIQADPVNFFGMPDTTRKSVSGTGALLLGKWDGSITGVPAGYYKVAVHITYINANDDTDKKTISGKSSKIDVP